MNPSHIFIARPVATTLLTIGVILAGAIAFRLLPVSPLPAVDFPTISVSASLPGASPETMAATVATPLERALGDIAGITEMTSSSSLSQTRVTLQFDLSRDIDGAARDVQAAINNARNLLPSALPSNPSYRKVNPADAPIMILALTSQTMTRGQLYDAADTILAQKLSQVKGVGEVDVGGSSQPAVRVELNPKVLDQYGIDTEVVRTAITATNVNRPKGSIESGERRWQIGANDQATRAIDYGPILVAYQNGAPVRLRDIAEVTDSVQDLHNAGLANGKPAVLIIITRQPNANIIDTVDRINAELPRLAASIPKAIDLSVMLDRTPTIRASLKEVERTLVTSVILVVLVVFVFLRRISATLIPSVAVPVSLIGTFGIMYLAGYSLDNLSLMALTISTGFVVDDAVVVLENISRHIEAGMKPYAAALQGAREVGFTVLSMSVSLVAVFIPILLMGGIVGRLLREFAVTLSVTIGVSLLVSLSTTPMMCAYLLKAESERKSTGRWQCIGAWSGRGFDRLLQGYERALHWALAHRRIMMTLLLVAVGLNVYLYVIVPKTFFPQQDTGRLTGNIQGDQAISFDAMQKKLIDFMSIIRQDPSVDTVVGFTGGSQVNTGRMFVSLKPLTQRRDSADAIIARLRKKLAREPGATLYLQAVQDIRIGGRSSNAQYQYTVQADDLDQLRTWELKIRTAMMRIPGLTDVNTDAQEKGSSSYLIVDRDAASRLGISAQTIDNTLNNLFGQRQVSTIFNPLNQYRVVMEADPKYSQSPESLQQVYVTTNPLSSAAPAAIGAATLAAATASSTGTAGASSSGAASSATSASSTVAASNTAAAASSSATPGAPASVIPLSAIAHYENRQTALAVNHQGQFPASTISFGLAENVSLSQATTAIEAAVARLGLPSTVQGSFQGTAQAFQDSLKNQPLLILAALIAVYIVLGILYESYVHPLTILSTLPSAGVGALLALLATGTQFSIMSLIGVILLIGIVKKNAIMMIDFALEAQRQGGKAPADAIFEACIKRFRPIMMTTAAALFGALPLALRAGDGAELRQPLGISIAGGLIVSQLLTLFTTPIVYLYMDRFQDWIRSKRPRASAAPASGTAAPASGTAAPASGAGTAAVCILALLVAGSLGGCAVGPDYKRPAVETAPEFKESKQWALANPQDHLQRGEWWKIYHDPDLDELMARVDVSNQNIRLAEAQYRAARALAEAARANFFPTVGANASALRERGSSRFSSTLVNPGTGGTGATTGAGTGTATGGGTGTTTGGGTVAVPIGGTITNTYNLSLDASWEIDVWGKLRRASESANATAEATSADLAAARLSAQAELAQDYFQIRATDAQQRLFDENIAGLQKSLSIVNNQYAVGVAQRSDVVQAIALLKATQAQALDNRITRAQYEHAIAVLIGAEPSKFSLAVRVGPDPPVPVIPTGVPSELLQRRPDIAGAERRVAAANAQIGVAEAAYFPSLSLTGSAGYESTSLSNLISAANRVWSVGPQLALTLFDAGARRAATRQAVANYDAGVATYRQTTLAAFQDVEDNLVALRVLDDEVGVQDDAANAAREAQAIAENQYKAGTVSYLNVVVAQSTALTDERSALTVRAHKLVASVALIKALGGGWSAATK